METEKAIKVSALMTAPRYENTYARNQIERALKALGIPLIVSGGVFYGQCMQKMMEQLLELEDVDYAITVDFDSLFTAKDLRLLLKTIIERDDIDAITGMQVRRTKPVMLGTVPGGREVEGGREILCDGSPIKATTAHFGLTVIDLKKLRSVPKPWFYAKPNADGTWGGESIDDDVWFWFQWRDAGNSLYIHPMVKLGHLEEMVAVFDEGMKAKHVYPAEWEAMSGY